jgi:hypothetical protein
MYKKSASRLRAESLGIKEILKDHTQYSKLASQPLGGKIQIGALGSQREEDWTPLGV